ncbi:hypothetical protein LCGC14_2539340 [marine sediment metagenome]|uniref:Uncharacterized protein n=1 Tax=marine sediment metagenome TaxID=412755 RepID=A0A0F9BDY9_9ZZZZ
MNYEREWGNPHNAVGFAAECARLALPFYSGDRRSDLVVAIEIAECCVNGALSVAAASLKAANAAQDVVYDADTDADVAVAACAAAAADAAIAVYATPAYYAVSADVAAARIARYAPAARIVHYAAAAANHAGRAGVCNSEIQVACARWVVRDLSGDDQDLDEELRQAAGAAIVAGDEDLARQLVKGIT